MRLTVVRFYIQLEILHIKEKLYIYVKNIILKFWLLYDIINKMLCIFKLHNVTYNIYVKLLMYTHGTKLIQR